MSWNNNEARGLANADRDKWVQKRNNKIVIYDDRINKEKQKNNKKLYFEITTYTSLNLKVVY